MENESLNLCLLFLLKPRKPLKSHIFYVIFLRKMIREVYINFTINFFKKFLQTDLVINVISDTSLT